jgi:hypothetical protein
MLTGRRVLVAPNPDLPSFSFSVRGTKQLTNYEHVCTFLRHCPIDSLLFKTQKRGKTKTHNQDAGDPVDPPQRLKIKPLPKQTDPAAKDEPPQGRPKKYPKNQHPCRDIVPASARHPEAGKDGCKSEDGHGIGEGKEKG